jgi:hypothetical protein
MSGPMNDREIGERFRALQDGSEPNASSELRRFVRDRAFLDAAPLGAVAGPRPAFRRAAVGIAAAFLLVLAGTGMWLSLHGPINGEKPTPSPTASVSPSPSPSTSIDASATPSIAPTDSPSSGPTDSQYPDPWTTYTFRPAPKSSPVAIAGNATVATKQRPGTYKAANLQWDFFEPLVVTPGRTAGGRIASAIAAVVDSRVAELKSEFTDPQNGLAPEHTVTLVTSFAVISSAGPKSDPSAGFVSIRIQYSFNNPPWADEGPQYIDVLVYDLKTGNRISISDLFTSTTTALQRLDKAAGANPSIAQWSNPQYTTTTGHEPKPENFAMWAPTRSGLETTFGSLQLGSEVSGTPAFTVPWSQLSDLFKPNSYLAWYADALSSSTAYPSGTIAPGSFGLTGSMLVPEDTPTTTLLQDGRVLVTGLAAQLYDPATGAFIPTGQMPNVRWGRSATLLQDGEVLVAGGANGDGTAFDASAQLYDPKTGKFTATGSMTMPRSFHTATLLKDGRVLIVGGNNTVQTMNSDGSSTPIKQLDSAELYDPRTGKFTPTGSMTIGRAFHTATLLANGRVLIAGGSPDGTYWSGPGSSVASAEIYDPNTGKFTATGSMTTARSFANATLLPDGRVLMAGGREGWPQLAAPELYDPKTGKFASGESTPTAHFVATAKLLQDGRVLFLTDLGPRLYDSQTGTSAATGAMVLNSDGFTILNFYPHAAVLLQDGRVLVLGGEATGASAEIYQP